MAGGGLRVNVYERALTDTRVRRVARKLGLSHYDVLGRFCHLWMLCYQRRTEFLHRVDADIATGELGGFVDAAVECEMVDVVDENTLRVRGAEHAIDVLEGQSEKGRKSGESRRAMSAALRERTEVQQGFRFGSNQSVDSVEPNREPRSDLISSDLREINNLPGDQAPRVNGSRRVRGPGPHEPAPPHSKTQHRSNGARSEPARRSVPEPAQQALTLAHLLMAAIQRNSPSGRLARAAPRLLQDTAERWAVTIDKLQRIDSMTWGEIEGMITWSQRDPFWRTVVLGADALRENWDKMVAQRSQRGGRQETRPGPTELARREAEELEHAGMEAVASSPEVG